MILKINVCRLLVKVPMLILEIILKWKVSPGVILVEIFQLIVIVLQETRVFDLRNSIRLIAKFRNVERMLNPFYSRSNIGI